MRLSRLTVLAAVLALAPGAAFALPAMFHRATTMNVSQDIPAAQAKVKFVKTDNGNITISLVVKYLADPHKLQPAQNTYVVWVRADKDAPAQNLGGLMVDSHRKGTLKTVTPLHAFQLFVTAEADGQIQAPAGPHLMWTDYNGD